MSLILAHWKAAAFGAAGIAAAMLLLLLQRERHARLDAERLRQAALAQASAARAQAALNQAAGTAAVAAETRTVHIVTRSEEAAHAILELPTADAPLPDAVRDGWAAGVDGLRRADAEPAAPDHSGG
jgi:hypothetical protein